MLPLLAAAGRAAMGLFRSGGSKAAANPAAKAGPRGANEVVEGGAKGAGKSSPMDMIGNVANVAMIGSMIPGLMPGGDAKKPPADAKPKSTYEPVLDH
ncbi:MAG: hypothetical protein JWP91_2140 [Fibrobacteres bacterium]|nr:hypothetical protein [Fibrobacterota bacterium]